MYGNYRVYDADSDFFLTPGMWEDLPSEFKHRRPPPFIAHDTEGMGKWSSGRLIDGRMQPHPYGPPTQGANRPGDVIKEFGALPDVGMFDLIDPEARVRGLDKDGSILKFSFQLRCMRTRRLTVHSMQH